MRFSRQPGGCSPPFPKFFAHPIPDGDAGVEQTIRWMQALVHGSGGVKSPEVRRAALEAARGTERGMHEIDAVFAWVKNNIEFRGEYGETLQEPRWTLEFRAGDCDDQSMLAAAMLNSLGYLTRFRTVALNSSPGELSHVYVEVRDRQSGQWIPLDPTVARSWPGWQPEDVARAVTYAPMRPAGGNSALVEGLIAVAALLLF